MKLVKAIVSILVAYLIFSLSLAALNTYDILLTYLLNAQEAFFCNELLFADYTDFKVWYPRYAPVIFILVKISQYKFIIYVLGTFIFLSNIYKKVGHKNLVLGFLLCFLIFSFLEGISNTDKLKYLLKTSINGKEFTEQLEHRPKYTADECGINTLLPSSLYLKEGYQVNAQGFRSSVNFNAESILELKKNNQIVMIIGDSHTEGCCASPITESFVDIINRKDSITGLNFGKGGLDPLQYRLITDKYIDLVKPNLVLIPFCFGNDFMEFDRKAMPYKALWLHTSNSSLSNLLPRTHPNFSPDTYFSSWEEAKAYYLTYHSLFGVKESTFEKYFIKPSALNTTLWYLPRYLAGKYYEHKSYKLFPIQKKNDITYDHLKYIQEQCEKRSISFVLVGVPSIRNIDGNNDYQNYRGMLKDLKIAVPTNLILEDYVSFADDHFVNSGHQKFANFLAPIIDSALHYQAFSKDSLVKE